MSKLFEWLKASWRWLLIGVAAALSIAVLGRKAKSLEVEKDYGQLKNEEASRRLQDVKDDQTVATEIHDREKIPAMVKGMVSDEVDSELKARGLD